MTQDLAPAFLAMLFPLLDPRGIWRVGAGVVAACNLPLAQKKTLPQNAIEEVKEITHES